MTKVGILWANESLGLYGNAPFDHLYRGIGRNNGNLAFVYAIVNQIQEKLTYIPWQFEPKQVADVDVIVIPCANQFGKHTDLGKLAGLLERADKPIIGIGLGAQAKNMESEVEVTPGTLEWLRVLNSHRPGTASNIYTRGPFTVTQLARFGVPDAVAGGCPSHFINENADLGQRIHQNWTSVGLPRAISVAAGHERWANARSVEHRLIAMMQDPVHPGQYVVQSMADMIKISRGEFDSIEPDVLAQIHAYTVPHYTLDEFKSWCRAYARSFYDIPSWMDSLRRYDLTIGPRYHGVGLAMQAERMGLTVAIDSRTEEMCVQTGIPHVRVDEFAKMPITRASLKTMIKFNPIVYDRQRSERARNYVAFLRANGLTPAPHLEKIAARPKPPVAAPTGERVGAPMGAPVPVAAAATQPAAGETV